MWLLFSSERTIYVDKRTWLTPEWMKFISVATTKNVVQGNMSNVWYMLLEVKEKMMTIFDATNDLSNVANCQNYFYYASKTIVTTLVITWTNKF